MRARESARVDGARLRTLPPTGAEAGTGNPGSLALVVDIAAMHACVCARRGQIVPGLRTQPPLQEPRRKIGTRARLV